MMSKPETVSTEDEFEFSGGALCLDFANTLGDRPRGRNEQLTGYADLLRWAGQAGILGQPERQTLERRAARREDASRRAFHHAIELREAIYRTFSALAAGERPEPRELAALNAALLATLPHLRLEPAGAGYDWAWTGVDSSLDSPLWPVVRSAADLLTSPETTLVRECASETCSWVFVDRSRTHRRRWCDMKTCGNRAKARRHYERTKKKPSSS
jgi:predicted RNA-binding Zn ribbon-like protein